MRVLPGKCEIKVRRTRVMEDSFAAVMARSGEDLKRRLMVGFEGEDGLDYGGVSRSVQGEIDERKLLGTKAFVILSENGSSFCLTRSSILAMDCLNIRPTIIILYRSTTPLALTPTI